MISEAKNERLTRTGPSTAAGNVLRLYWQPAALVEELSDDRPVCAVTLLGEQLVLFRNDNGGYGLIDRHCPHRNADLSYGRCEDGGLRCPFHGWLFDTSGQCLEQPAEPEGSKFHEKLRVVSYPCQERSGIIWAYLGPGTPPELPNFDCFFAPDTHVFAFKGLWKCNWLQALEVGIDPAHASYLHRFFEDEDTSKSYGRQFRDRGAAETDIPMTKLLRDYPRPELSVETKPYGMQIKAVRRAGQFGVHVRVTNQIFPNAICIPMSTAMTITQWHVPVDDYNCYWYSIFTSFSDPVDKNLMREQRLKVHTLPLYEPIFNKRNRYGFDAKEQLNETYTGMGYDINVHDQWAVESPGPISDRTREHLGKSDIAIIQYRRQLEKAMNQVEEGNHDLPARGVVATSMGSGGPRSIDSMIAPGRDIEEWIAAERKRRAESPWAATIDD